MVSPSVKSWEFLFIFVAIHIAYKLRLRPQFLLGFIIMSQLVPLFASNAKIFSKVLKFSKIVKNKCK